MLHPVELELNRTWPASERSAVTSVLAVSGGADSVALARACLATHLPGPGRLLVAHYNHHLRGDESQQDAQFVAELCRQWQLPFLLGEWPPEAVRSDEDSARAARYQFLTEQACQQGARYVATAHTADDQAETILYRILRGTSLEGLRGIAIHRPLIPGISLMRPLVELPRQVLLDYLQSVGQEYRRDSSNDDPRYTRNRIRHELLPWLQREVNPAIAAALVRLGQTAAEAQDFVTSQAQSLLELATEPASPGEVRLNCEPLRHAPPAVLKQLFLIAWRGEGWGLGELTARHWNDLAELAGTAEPVPLCRHFPGAIEARRTGSTLVLRRLVREAPES